MIGFSRLQILARGFEVVFGGSDGEAASFGLVLPVIQATVDFQYREVFT